MISQRVFSNRQLMAMLTEPESYWRRLLRKLPAAAGALDDLIATPIVAHEMKELMGEFPDRETAKECIRRSLVVLHEALGVQALAYLFKIQPVETIASVLPIILTPIEVYQEREQEKTDDGSVNIQISVVYAALSHLALECFPNCPLPAMEGFLDSIPMPFSMARSIMEEFSDEVEKDIEATVLH